MHTQRNKVRKLKQKYVENFCNFRVKFPQQIFLFFSANFEKFQRAIFR